FAEPFEILTIISMSYRSGLLPCSGIHECPKSYRSFHVNCGGPDINSGGILYKGDGNIESDAARIYFQTESNWGFSNTGDFMDDGGQRTYCPEPGEASKIPIVVGVVTSALLLVFLVMGVICWKFYFRDKFMRERDLKGLDLKTGSFTLRQLRAATNNFDSAGKIGEGGFGSVFKTSTQRLVAYHPSWYAYGFIILYNVNGLWNLISVVVRIQSPRHFSWPVIITPDLWGWIL
ncbi:hypothetical protein D5086_010445, partial [Populus alba]